MTNGTTRLLRVLTSLDEERDLDLDLVVRDVPVVSDACSARVHLDALDVPNGLGRRLHRVTNRVAEGIRRAADELEDLYSASGRLVMRH